MCSRGLGPSLDGSPVTPHSSLASSMLILTTEDEYLPWWGLNRAFQFAGTVIWWLRLYIPVETSDPLILFTLVQPAFITAAVKIGLQWLIPSSEILEYHILCTSSRHPGFIFPTLLAAVWKQTILYPSPSVPKSCRQPKSGFVDIAAKAR